VGLGLRVDGMGRIRIGLSGWRYKGWRGDFYPAGLPQRRELAYVAEKFDTVEINGSFYSLRSPSNYRTWESEVGEDFVFAVKGGRFITHMKQLRDVEVGLANFFASGVLALGHTHGPTLWQLPARMRYDQQRMQGFLELLPATAEAAAELAVGHDDKVKDPWTEAGPDRAVRHAIEVRHESFADPSFFDLLRTHGVGLVVTHGDESWPLLEEVTADVMYVRLHGSPDVYASGYSDEELAGWAAKIRTWSNSADVYVYFDNDARGHAPWDAQRLAALLAGGHGRPAANVRQNEEDG
jgi:uncharacterized protein YecE (DUF72 family)